MNIRHMCDAVEREQGVKMTKEERSVVTVLALLPNDAATRLAAVLDDCRARHMFVDLSAIAWAYFRENLVPHAPLSPELEKILRLDTGGRPYEVYCLSGINPCDPEDVARVDRQLVNECKRVRDLMASGMSGAQAWDHVRRTAILNTKTRERVSLKPRRIKFRKGKRT